MSDRVVALGIGLTAIVATAVGVNIAVTPGAPPAHVEAARPRASVPIVLPVPQPQLLVVQAPPPPAPEPPPPPEPPEPPQPRAATPRLDIDCELAGYSDGDERSPTCDWDRGFPAISADGRTIAEAIHLGDGGRGYPALEVRFVDVATSRRISTHTILDPDELEDGGIPSKRVRAKIDRRAARVTATLASGRYRSFAHVQRPSVEFPNGDLAFVPGLRADIEGDRIRIVDETTNTSLVERRYDVAAQFPNRKLDPDTESCDPTGTHWIDAWWDARTRTLLTEVGYGAGPCYCDDVAVEYVTRL